MKDLKKNFFVLSLATMFLAGCSNSEEFYNVEPELHAITMSSGVGAMTRSAIISDDQTKLPSADIAVGFFRAPDAATADWTTPSVVDATFKTNGEIVWSAPQYYHKDDLKAHFIGFYPSASGVPAVSGTTATWAIDGKTDVLLSNYVSGDKTIKTGTGIDENLTPHFQHLLSWLDFSVKYDGEGADEVWGDVESIVIKKVSQSVSTDLTGLSYNAAYVSTTGDISTYDVDWTAAPSAQALTNTATFFSQTLVAPKDKYTILVSTENGGNKALTVTFPNGEPAAGTKHNVTLTFTLKGITMTATLEPWADGDDGVVDPIE